MAYNDPYSEWVYLCVYETWTAAFSWPLHHAWPASHPLRPPPAGGTCPPALGRVADTAPARWTSEPSAPPSAGAPETVTARQSQKQNIRVH